eukprot:gene1679-1041_t
MERNVYHSAIERRNAAASNDADEATRGSIVGVAPITNALPLSLYLLK